MPTPTNLARASQDHSDNIKVPEIEFEDVHTTFRRIQEKTATARTVRVVKFQTAHLSPLQELLTNEGYKWMTYPRALVISRTQH